MNENNGDPGPLAQHPINSLLIDAGDLFTFKGAARMTQLTVLAEPQVLFVFSFALCRLGTWDLLACPVASLEAPCVRDPPQFPLKFQQHC